MSGEHHLSQRAARAHRLEGGKDDQPRLQGGGSHGALHLGVLAHPRGGRLAIRGNFRRLRPDDERRFAA